MAQPGRKKQPRHSIPALEQHGTQWRWRPTIDGQRLMFKLRATDEAGAISEVLQLRKNPNIYSLGTWEKEVEKYLASRTGKKRMADGTADNRRIALFAIGRQLEVKSPREVTPAMVSVWLDGELARLGPTISVREYLTHLRLFFSHLVISGALLHNPTEGIEGPLVDKNTRDTFIALPKLMEIFQAARATGDRDLEWILALGCECGMRKGEIDACRPEWFDLEAGTLTVPKSDLQWKRKGQTGKRRSATVPLSWMMLELIGRHGLPSPYIVAPTKAKGASRYRFEFRKKITTFFLSQKLPEHTTIHDMRRSFASNRVSKGTSIEKIANWMGIDRETAWKRYSRFLPADDEINQGSAGKAPVAPPAVIPAPPAAPSSDLKARLQRVEDLHQAGLITDDERAAKRAEILAAL